MLGSLRFAIFFLFALQDALATQTQNGTASTTTTNDPGPSALSSPGAGRATSDNATCHSRTINYITNTLPQQCLRTNRASVAASNATDGSLQDVTTSSSTDVHHTATSPGSHGTSSEAAVGSNSDTRADTTAAPTQKQNASVASTESTTEIHAASTLEPEAETDSPLDNANFLSFEDWKRQNLAKAGQSPENLGARSQPQDPERRRPGINNALDTLGEESEIELDFSGFGASHDDPSQRQASHGASDSASVQSSLTPHTARSKDAGKTCKERTNYASFDCAATILKNNPESKSGSAILVENKDSYMLNKCTADNKFVIVELCSDILVDTIVLANYEFFSSIFRHFRISVSDRYPVKMEKWKDLGTFEARNTREVQAFLVENPLIWARYLRIEFLTHYGNEYYCPVSLLRVHGTTMMDEFRHQEEIARGEVQDDEVVVEQDVPAQTTVPQSVVVSIEAAKDTASENASTITQPSETTPASRQTPAATHTDQETLADDRVGISDKCPADAQHIFLFEQSVATQQTCANTAQSSDQNPSRLSRRTATQSPIAKPTSESSEGSPTPSIQPPSIHDKSSSGEAQATTSSERLQSTHSSTAGRDSTSSRSAVREEERASTQSATGSPSSTPSTSISTNTAIPNSQTREDPSTASPNKHAPGNSDSIRPAVSSTTTAQAAQPTTQESFFKSVHKRLQQLESNSTLSLQYIEEQSRILRDAFSKVEKRQVAATSNFLSNLNATVMGELQGFRTAYDQLWQSTVIELEGQRDQYQREMLALSTRLSLVADELVWQKRMGIVQSTLLLLCLALVLFNRAGSTALVEMPLLQQMMNKSQAALRAGWESPPGSRSPENRSPENRSPVSLFRKRPWRHQSAPSGSHGTDGSDNSRPQSRDATTPSRPDVTLEAPTPPSAGAEADSEDESDWKEVPEVQSGPATPRGTREALGSPSWSQDGARTGSSLSLS